MIGRPVVEPSIRFWSKVDRNSECWLWQAAISCGGYGFFWDGARQVYSHRFSYELTNGAIPKRLTIDHLCRNRRCVRPSHLEAVPMQVNIQRGENNNRIKTHCPQSHPYSPENTYRDKSRRRRCRICVLARARRRRLLSVRIYTLAAGWTPTANQSTSLVLSVDAISVALPEAFTFHA